jgi:origin recognition complex subunit 1
MVPKRQRTKLERARQLLKTGGVYREDSDDELGTDDYPWEWIYDRSSDAAKKDVSHKRSSSAAFKESDIVGARMGKFECYLGECVLLKAEGNEAWVGMITHFFEEEETENKMANLMWFSSPWEIRNKVKARPEALEVRLMKEIKQTCWLNLARMSST